MLAATSKPPVLNISIFSKIESDQIKGFFSTVKDEAIFFKSVTTIPQEGRIRILQELQAMPVLIHIYGLVSFLVVKDEYARPQRPCQPVSEPIQRR
ncbi:uncharacterized protein LOC121982215 isoform X2 [Zingiber officinale]|uniref:uncharacterized protein LOC121982215 isoform X2 n=1 Tax=Zingiber officinale TaxID=94328 RepID=UPI001C4D2DC4|nr:uncharacterized protein LOC121982215 isoform X2 [Zingiber officinale]